MYAEFKSALVKILTAIASAAVVFGIVTIFMSLAFKVVSLIVGW